MKRRNFLTKLFNIVPSVFIAKDVINLRPSIEPTLPKPISTIEENKQVGYFFTSSGFQTSFTSNFVDNFEREGHPDFSYRLVSPAEERKMAYHPAHSNFNEYEKRVHDVLNLKDTEQ